jgi:hypothetical protein
MGNNFAQDLAENIDISLEQAIGYHLQGNHYPPVPLRQDENEYYGEDAGYELGLGLE